MNSRILLISLLGLMVSTDLPVQESDLDLSKFCADHFTFVRIKYESVGGDGEAYYRGDVGWIPRWATDHPVGAKNLTWRLNQLTTIKANQGTLLRSVLDSQTSQWWRCGFIASPFSRTKRRSWKVGGRCNAQYRHRLRLGTRRG